MNSQEATVKEPGFAEDLKSCWAQLPNKAFFFLLLAAWLAMFQFVGNSVFGYVDTSSLFRWMYLAYNSTSVDATDGHGNMVPFVVLFLMWWKRKELLAQSLKVWWPGLLIVVFAIVLHIIGYLVQQPRVSIVALFIGIYGLMGMAWGLRFLVVSFFPYVLFVFMVPLGSVTGGIAFKLRLLVTHIVAFICQHILAINVMGEGTRLFKPSGYEYEVAAACSGIKSLVAIIGISVVYAFTMFQKRWERALLLIVSLPLAVIGNVFRVLMIVIAAEVWGQQAGKNVHENFFWSLLPYIPAFIGLILIGRWLERLGSNDKPVQPSAPPKVQEPVNV